VCIRGGGRKPEVDACSKPVILSIMNGEDDLVTIKDVDFVCPSLHIRIVVLSGRVGSG
jgi:hypothetical protein